MLISLTTIGLLGVAAIELGWMLTELGRQPWAVYGYVLTKDAFTTSPGVQTRGIFSRLCSYYCLLQRILV